MAGRHSRKLFYLSQRPSNFDIRRTGRAEPEVEPEVVNREVRRLAQDFLRLYLVAVPNRDPATDGAAVRLDARQLYFDPVVVAREVVAQQRRWLVVIHDQDVDVAVVVKVSECATAARVQGLHARPGILDQFLELRSSEISENDARRAVVVSNLWVDAAGYAEDVGIAIVIQVRHTTAPGHEPCFRAQAGAKRLVMEIAFSV